MLRPVGKVTANRAQSTRNFCSRLSSCPNLGTSRQSRCECRHLDPVLSPNSGSLKNGSLNRDIHLTGYLALLRNRQELLPEGHPGRCAGRHSPTRERISPKPEARSPKPEALETIVGIGCPQAHAPQSFPGENGKEDSSSPNPTNSTSSFSSRSSCSGAKRSARNPSSC